MKQAPPFKNFPLALFEQIRDQGSGYITWLSTSHLGDRQGVPVTVHASRYTRAS